MRSHGGLLRMRRVHFSSLLIWQPHRCSLVLWVLQYGKFRLLHWLPSGSQGDRMGFQANPNDISVADGRRIVAEAATWKGTPYALDGPGSVKGVSGDCSGSTNLIYKATVFPYPYKNAAAFRVWAPTSKLFRQLGPLDHPQDGDILFLVKPHGNLLHLRRRPRRRNHSSRQ